MKLFGRKKTKPEEVASDSPASDERVWQPFDHVTENSQRNPEGLAIVSERGELNNREYFQRAKKLSQVLRGKGVKPGHIVGAELDGVDQFLLMAALFHEAAIGCVAPKAEVLPKYFDWLVTTSPDRPVGPNTRLIHWSEELETEVYRASSVLSPNAFESWDTNCRILFSSGTTGAPKAIPMTVGQLHETVTRALQQTMKPEPFYSAIALSGLSGFVTAVANLASGTPYICPSGDSWSVEVLRSRGIQTLKASPAQLASILRLSKDSGNPAPNLDHIQSTGSLISQRLAHELESYFSATVVNRFGCTEAGALCHGTGYRLDPSDVGEPHPGVIVQVVDAEDVEVSPGQEGRLRWKTPVQVYGYYNAPEETELHFREGWFYSGDVGYVSPNGHVHIVGRESEIFNLGGNKYNPELLDTVAKEYAGIRDAATFAFTDANGITQLGIAVVADSNLNRQGYLEHFFRSTKGLKPAAVLPVATIPRGELGKVQRVSLADQTQRKLQ